MDESYRSFPRARRARAQGGSKGARGWIDGNVTMGPIETVYGEKRRKKEKVVS